MNRGAPSGIRSLTQRKEPASSREAIIALIIYPAEIFIDGCSMQRCWLEAAENERREKQRVGLTFFFRFATRFEGSARNHLLPS